VCHMLRNSPSRPILYSNPDPDFELRLFQFRGQIVGGPQAVAPTLTLPGYRKINDRIEGGKLNCVAALDSSPKSTPKFDINSKILTI